MLLQGSFNPTHLIREFFLLEYAFEICWNNRITIRVAHRRGTWVLYKAHTSKPVDAFEFSDGLMYPALIFSPPSGLIRGFLEAKIAAQVKHPASITRKEICHALTELIHFWGGPLEEIDSINVVQPGRNAYLTDTGDFDLSPQPESWKK